MPQLVPIALAVLNVLVIYLKVSAEQTFSFRIKLPSLYSKYVKHNQSHLAYWLNNRETRLQNV